MHLRCGRGRPACCACCEALQPETLDLLPRASHCLAMQGIQGALICQWRGAGRCAGTARPSSTRQAAACVPSLKSMTRTPPRQPLRSSFFLPDGHLARRRQGGRPMAPELGARRVKLKGGRQALGRRQEPPARLMGIMATTRILPRRARMRPPASTRPLLRILGGSGGRTVGRGYLAVACRRWWRQRHVGGLWCSCRVAT